eukprot:Hpha_TRINITY_DN3913_c0_g1::TRINITY_DN3913_c0_g1_i1::g.18019::m.18019
MGGGEEAVNIEWLRQRGVEVETREDRERAKAAREAPVVEGRKVVCVVVPWDTSEEVREVEVTAGVGLPGAEDPFVPALATRFADDKGVQAELVGAQLKQMLGGTGSDVDPSRIASVADRAVADGACEAFPVQAAWAGNAHTQVAIYLDSVGVLKALPRNPRAEALAGKCGCTPAPAIHGNVIIARIQGERTGRREPVAFGLQDMADDAGWVGKAAQENVAAGHGRRCRLGRQGCSGERSC